MTELAAAISAGRQAIAQLSGQIVRQFAAPVCVAATVAVVVAAAVELSLRYVVQHVYNGIGVFFLLKTTTAAQARCE